MSTEIPSREESVRMISEILKRTNQLIRKGELERAQGELILANRAAKEKYKKSVVPAPSKDKSVRPPIPSQPLPLAPIEAIATISAPRQVTSKVTSEKPQAPPGEQSNDRSIEFDYYREALNKAWLDGALTQDEKRQLQELRIVLEISDVEHEVLEKEIKHSRYKEAFVQRLSNDSSLLSNTQSLSELREIYNISPDDHAQIQNQLIDTGQNKKQDKILIIDDDIQFLNMLNASMAEDGFDVTAVATCDEAFTLFQKYSPDLILCDINLETSTMNGFAFFEKVQKNKYLQQVPFIFITGLKDEKLTCTGKEIGADDILMKPISRHTLLSTLHGRLKRFKQLRDYPETPAPAFCS